MPEYDVVIVGGGTAGSVLAGRLSERPDLEVLLLEAGPLHAPEAVSVPAAWPTLRGSAVDWQYSTVPQPALHDRVLPYPRGKVLGGSGAVNALVHARGHRSAIDAWAKAGATGWGFDDLLPYYRRSEHVDGDDAEYRGVGGPMRPSVPAAMDPAAQSFLNALHELDLSSVLRPNDPYEEGVGRPELNVVDGRRQTAADAYLRPHLDRSNLTVVTDALVHELVIVAGRCTGVRFTAGGELRTAGARREVVLSAGAIGSPHLLLRSGIGPADELRRLGVPVVADVPGVGAHLSEQPVVGVVGVASRQVPPSVNNHIDVLGAVRSSPELDTPDLGVAFLNYLPQHPALGPPQTGFTVLVAAMAPHSRGSVRLASARPEDAPLIDLGLLTDTRDTATLLTGIRLARRICAARAMAEWDAVEAVPGPRAETDEELSAYVRQAGTVYYHPAGTCAMGTGPEAVTDLELRVRGVDGLRVVDASVMPSLPAAPPNATVLAIAERAADLIGRS